MDKFLNRMISRVRIVVENVISGVKRCRIVKDELRLTKEKISDVVMGDCVKCCGNKFIAFLALSSSS